MSTFELRELLPWRSFTIATSWTPTVAAVELRKRVGPGQPFRMALLAPRAAVTGMRFRFARAIGYRNSFLPVIDVSVLPGSQDSARVAVRMRPIGFVAVFMALWLTGTTVGALLGLWAAVWNGQLVGLAVPLLPAFGIALAGGSFAYEARKAEEILRGIFPPAPLPTDGPYR